MSLVVWVIVGSDPFAELGPVVGTVGHHYVSSIVFPFHMLYYLVLVLRLEDRESGIESIFGNLLLVSLTSVKYDQFLYFCLASCLGLTIHASLSQVC